MCGRKSRAYSLLLALALLLSASPCSSEVVLTDEEAQEMLSEMEQSKKELTTLKEQSQALQTELEELRDTSEEQSQSYERRLQEAEKEKRVPWVIAGASSVITLILSIAMILLAI